MRHLVLVEEDFVLVEGLEQVAARVMAPAPAWSWAVISSTGT